MIFFLHVKLLSTPLQRHTWLVPGGGGDMSQERLLRKITDRPREPDVIGTQDYMAQECVISNPTAERVASLQPDLYSGLYHCATSLEHTCHPHHDDPDAYTTSKHYYNPYIPQPDPF